MLDREGIIMPCGPRRIRRRQQRGGILPLLLPIAVGAAIALKKKKKKKVGKISAKQQAFIQRRVQRMLGRTGWGGFKTLRKL